MKTISLTLKIWRQADAQSAGSFYTFAAKDIGCDMSFLEMLDVVNEQLIKQGR